MTRVPPLALVVAAGVAQRLLARGRGASAASRAAGVVLGAGSVALTGSSVALFRREHTTVDPVHPDQASALVTGGVHRFTRNPMYVGMAGVLVAHAVHRRSWAALLPVAAFVAAVDRLQVPAEETALRARFGADYDAYCARVPRWVGRPSSA